MKAIPWEQINAVFTVESLMTLREDLFTYTLNAQEQIPNDEQPFDVVPLVQDGTIVGVLEKGSKEVQPLSSHWLVTRDTSIPDLLTLFVKTRRSAFLVYSRQEVIGLVSPADLNKLPARAYFYNLIGELEIGLARLIRQECESSPNLVVQSLTPKRQVEMEKTKADLAKGNAEVDLLEFLYLAELIGILEKKPELRQRLNLGSRNKAEKMFSGINDLRTQTMHLVRPLLTRIPQDLDTLQGRLLRIYEILDRLEQQANIRA